MLNELFKIDYKVFKFDTHKICELEEKFQKLFLTFIFYAMGTAYNCAHFFCSENLEDMKDQFNIWNNVLKDITVEIIFAALDDLLNARTEYIDWPPKTAMAFKKVCLNTSLYRSKRDVSSLPIKISEEESSRRYEIGKKYLSELRDKFYLQK